MASEKKEEKREVRVKSWRDVDKLIAQEIFQWSNFHIWHEQLHGEWGDGLKEEVPYYTEDIEVAWLVVEKLRPSYCCFQILSDYNYTWTIRATIPEHAGNPNHEYKCYYDGTLDICKAICIAALRMKGVEINREDFRKLPVPD